MWPFDHPFSAYTWPGPFGWFARECPGNIVAGFAQGAIAAVVAMLLWPPTRHAIHRFVDEKLKPVHEHFARQSEHNKWMAEHLARVHLAATGKHAADHPEHGPLTHPEPTPPRSHHKKQAVGGDAA